MVRAAANKTATPKTEPAVGDIVAVAGKPVTAADKTADGNSKEAKEVTEMVVEAPAKAVPEKTKTAEKELVDSDEIEVVSLIPNVSYEDGYTHDFYEWHEVGHVEFMKFETVSRMWRNHRGYLKDMWLKPNDERVIKKLGLEGTYDKYDFLMDSESYTKDNIANVIDSIGASPKTMKIAIVTCVKDLVTSGKLNDVFVIKALDRQLGLDLINLI